MTDAESPKSALITGKQKKFLRGLAHSLDPVVQVGKEGATEAVVRAVDRALLEHELIKVKLLETSPDERDVVAEKLATALRATVAGQIGKVVILYRGNKKNPKIILPK